MEIKQYMDEAEQHELNHRRDKAIEAYRQALIQAQSKEIWPLVAEINERLATLCRELGRHRLAMGHYQAALASYEKASPKNAPPTWQGYFCNRHLNDESQAGKRRH